MANLFSEVLRLVFFAGVNLGTWYYEVKINDIPNEAATRIGFSQSLGLSDTLLTIYFDLYSILHADMHL